MLQHMILDGELKIGQHKTIDCKVELEVATIEEDEWAEPDPTINREEYIDGVRVTGELSFDTSPIRNSWTEKHPVRKGVVAELTVRQDGESSKLSILLVEQTAANDILKGQIKRYFWLFFAVAKPTWDQLKIFPEGYRGRTMNRIYYCTDFRGYWPVGVSSVIVATDKVEAKQLLKQKLRDAGIPPEGDEDYTLTEISIENKGAVILNDGQY